MVVAGSETASSLDWTTDCAESDDEERRLALALPFLHWDDVVLVDDESWPNAQGGGIGGDGRDTNAPADDRHNSNAIDLREWLQVMA